MNVRVKAVFNVLAKFGKKPALKPNAIHLNLGNWNLTLLERNSEIKPVLWRKCSERLNVSLKWNEEKIVKMCTQMVFYFTSLLFERS